MLIRRAFYKPMKNTRVTLALLCSLSLFLSSCGFQSSKSSIKNELEAATQCRNFRSLFWQTLNQASLETPAPQSWSEIKNELLSSEDSRLHEWVRVVERLEKSLGEEFWQNPVSEQTEIWAQLELGVDVRPGFTELLQSLEAEIQSLTPPGTQNCSNEVVPPIDSVELANISQGARRVMAVAYQSCEAPKLSALDEFTRPMNGVTETGNHSDGVGRVRKIANLASVQQTHPYLRIQNREPSCFAVENKPLIYDYGGKPSYPSAKGSLINIFKNSGSGSTELGIDCSALVVASLGMTGLRLKPKEVLTASQTAAFGTATLIQSPKYFPCLDYIPLGINATLAAGDIITVQGHTVIVDSVGADPFGIQGVNTQAACQALDGSRFDFAVLHSSPLFGATGIQRLSGRAYMKLSDSKMTRGILKYAKQQCLLSLQNKVQKPQWTDVSIVRHKGTPDCKGAPLQMEKQACVSSCW